MAPFPGGVLIKTADGSTVLGAVGVSGGASNDDEFCAMYGVQQSGLECTTRPPIENTLML